MDLLSYILLGLLLPTAAGAALARSLLPATPGFQWPEWLGFGWLLGVGLASLAMHLAPQSIYAGAITTVGALIIVACAAYFSGKLRGVAIAERKYSPHLRVLWVVVVLLGGLVVVQTVLVAMEILSRPTYPWDAWSSWAYKAKAWYLVGHQPGFLAPLDWPRAQASDVFSVLGENYPTLIAGYQVYLAAWLGQWREPLLNLPWLFCHLSLGCIFVGEARRMVGHWGLALTATLALMSVPFLVTHTALAGYMDLWLATGLLALCVASGRAQEIRGTRAWLLVVLLALFCLGLKVEAAVWVSLVAIAALIRLLLQWFKPKPRTIGVGLTLLGSAFITLLIILKDTIVTVPYIGRFAFALNEQFRTVLASLFLSWNWHLFYWIALFVLSIRVFTAGKRRFTYATLYCDVGLLSAVTLVFLFLFTSIHGATADITNYNRLLLQWLPVQGMCLLTLLEREVSAPQ